MSDATEKPKKTLDLVAELHERINELEEKILVLTETIKAKATSKSIRKEGN